MGLKTRWLVVKFEIGSEFAPFWFTHCNKKKNIFVNFFTILFMLIMRNKNSLQEEHEFSFACDLDSQHQIDEILSSI